MTAKLRLMAPDGSFEDFPYDRYTDFISEHIESLELPEVPVRQEVGQLLHGSGDNPGVYRANTLARINVCDFHRHAAGAGRTRGIPQKFGRPAQLTLLYHWARLIELLYNAENAIRLLDDPDITSTRNPRESDAARGARSGLHGSAPRHADPRLHDRR
jgi:F420-non-reducing hydrogenase large subunit